MEKNALRQKWRNAFGDAPYPCVFVGRDGLDASTSDLRLALQTTQSKLAELKEEIRQQEFIKDNLETLIKKKEKIEESERDDRFINEYVYSVVRKDKSCPNPPCLVDPELTFSRCDDSLVTPHTKQDYSLGRAVNGSPHKASTCSLDGNTHGIKTFSWSHSGADNSVPPRAPVPARNTVSITSIDNDQPDSDYGRVWVVPTKIKPGLSKRYSTGMMPTTKTSTNKQPPPVPKKPPKPQPAPRRSLSKSKSSEWAPDNVCRSDSKPQFCSLPREAALDTEVSKNVDNLSSKETEGVPPPMADKAGCASSLPSKHLSGLEYTNDVSRVTGDSFSLDTGEPRGVKDLCAASLSSAVNIDSSLTHEEEAADNVRDSSDTDMKKLYRTKSDKKSDSEVLLQGTYRKLSDEDDYQTVSIKTDDCGVVDVAMRSKKDKTQTEISTSSGDSTGTVTEGYPGKHTSHDSAPSYENWTIDRCLTRHDDSNDSDESENVYDNMVFGEVSPASTLQKHPYKGSKDSGLADDLSTNDSSPSVSDSVSVNTEGSTNDGAIDVSKPTTASDDDDDDDDDGDNGECMDVLPTDSSDGDEAQADTVSLASDIVFIHASDLPTHSEEPSQETSHDQSHEQPPEVPYIQASPHHAHVAQLSTDSLVVSSGEEETSFDETDVELSARDKLLQMRQLIVKGVLESEKSYLNILELLINYKRSLEASSRSSQPVITQEDTDAIFSNIQGIYKIHQEFVNELEPKVTGRSCDQKIGETFKMMIFKFPEFGNYMRNYQKAVSTIHKCSQDNPRFEDIAGKVTFSTQAKEVTNLEDALFKPVQRVQRNTLVLHDLIKYTPEDHADYKVLQKALQLAQYNLDEISSTIHSSGALPEEKRHLVKNSFLVELVSGQRKVRYVFLFSDILICTKKENRNKSHFDVKWMIPLCSLSMDTHFDYQDDLKHSHKENIEEIKRKIGQLKSDLRDEMKKEGSRESKHWSISGLAAARNVDKLKKKINELEAQLILHMPKLPVKVHHEGGKTHTLLMTTDYEREEWLETMSSLCRKCSGQDPGLGTYEIQELINSCKELPQVNKIGSVLMQKDEEILNGTLNVTIHKLNGLTVECDTYCCVEMDSYDHFFMKARTDICRGSADPAWDQDFELELDGTQTLRILVYETVDKLSDKLVGRGALELSKSWLKTNFQEKTISMNDVSLVISVRHTPANRTMRRTPSQQKSAVFGIKISTCARREGKTVPSIVTACIQEVEKRGIDETGIYRVSGVTSEVQRLKKGFDKNVRVGTHIVSDCDIHAVTGLLKLYFRELPEPLFTEANYTNFIDTLKLADKEAQEKCMLTLLHSLPDANYYTIVTLLEHLVRVAKNVKENKMTVHNLATVFGPTLLAPAVKDTGIGPLEMMSKTTEQVMHQSAIVNYLLSLAAQGRSLRRSAKC